MTHAHARRLIKRYLSASARWTGKLDTQLRAHLRECDACAREYDRAVIQHRLMLGLDTAMPSGFERRRMADEDERERQYREEEDDEAMMPPHQLV